MLDNKQVKEKTVKYLRQLADQIESGHYGITEFNTEARNMAWDIEILNVNIELCRSINHE